MPLEVSPHTDGLSFWIHATPRSHHVRLGGIHGDALRVTVREAAIEGAANEACRIALAAALGVPRSDVQLPAASRGRRKRVRVRGDPRLLEARLRALASQQPSD